MRRSGQASASESAGLNAEIAPIFLCQNICRKLAGSEQAVFRLIYGHALVNAVREIRMPFLNLPASFMFDQRKIIRRIPIDLIGRCENKNGFRTITSGCFQQHQGPISVNREIGERLFGGPIVAWLRSRVDDERDILASLVKDCFNSRLISNVDRKMSEVIKGLFK